MKIEDAWSNYVDFSGRASEVGRQLGFAGIALVWLAKGTDDVGPLPHALLWPTGLLALALALDFLQYVVASVIWRIYARHRETKFPSDAEFLAPPSIPLAIEVFYVLKFLALIVAYIMLFVYLGGKLATGV